jgi:pimeloyl-ACP methyl ester carboxylesterase
MKATGAIATYWPQRFKTSSTWRLMKLEGTSGEWHRWATAAVLSWNVSPEAERIPLIQIHGDSDETFPIRYTKADHVISGGGHVLPLTHCEELADILLAPETYFDARNN